MNLKLDLWDNIGLDVLYLKNTPKNSLLFLVNSVYLSMEKLILIPITYENNN